MEDATPQHPDLPLFKMPRQHKQGYWSFVMLVAPSAHLPAGKSKWESSDADMAYCTKCKATFKYKSGSSAAIRQHLGQQHPKVLAELQGNMKRKDASKLVKDAIASKRMSSTVFLSPTKKSKKVNSAEEAMATRLLTDWINKCLRPLGITEDKELRFLRPSSRP
ncbi:uncharacterized protein PHALS_08178 [Plasmopara halstedii]|uniref:BED-type domain-containing protein n=1 Tax=Plasmopara halstedii TaxID=4781 RepID=A0A0N7L499_PLAHL|nr:uncharacterized protein PHALS_08178 [Plasmopara halstedii]CEG38083.1 hypothetical protein PHALS_08178 [Plasmopara halstedii]|eukprot:XP_024574452.1 hypothetical protein PHALS_08178 [Plasmopara halstedii]